MNVNAEVNTGNTAVITREAAEGMALNTRKMGEMILQMAGMMAQLQRRMDEMEQAQAAVTIRHADVKRINGMIRQRAEQICEKYELTDPESRKVIRAAIKRDLLKRFGIGDLHDLPAAALERAGSLVDSWVNIRIVMERRGAQ